METLGFFSSIQWLTRYEIVLCIIDLFLLVQYTIPVLRRVKWISYVPVAGMIIAIFSFAYGDATLPALVLYALTLFIFLCTIPKLLRPSLDKMVQRRLFWRIVLLIAGLLPILFVFAVAGELRYNPVTDSSQSSYKEAFLTMNQRLSTEYPFGEWKGVDWDQLKKTYEPRFAEADKNQDAVLYYKTLREYLYSFQDGHIKIVNEQLFDQNSIFKSEVGGGFGLSTVLLEDGRVLVSLVLKNSPAERKGIKVGTEIVKWNGLPAEQVYKSTTWSDNPPTTADVKRENQGRFMVRAPIGKEIPVEFRNLGRSTTQTTVFTAYDDHFETLKVSRIKLTPADLEKSPIESKILENDYGYVRIKYFLSTTKPAKELEEVLLNFQHHNVKGIILDLRNNPGGEDELAAEIAGSFIREEKHYEYVSYYNRYTRSFKLNSLETLRVKPNKRGYTGPLAILINSRTASSGEGLPLMLKDQPNVVIVGFTGTNGSFGILSRPITFHMPEGYIVQFPDGRSLNKNKGIQLDSGVHGMGGVSPDIRIPLTEKTFTERYINMKDIEVQTAVAALESKAGSIP